MTNFFSVVFTLSNKSVSENKYINSFWLMFNSLYRSGSFNPLQDNFYVMADEPTWDLLQTRWNYNTPFVFWIRIPRPDTLLEGIARRYEILEQISSKDTFVYLDTDMMNIKKFSVSLPPDTIAVYPEGGATDPNYCGEGSWATLDHPGFSAGFWAIRSGPDMKALLSEIRASISRGPHNFYCVEQPHFNAAITKKTRGMMFNPRIVSFNGHQLGPETLFINCAGEPGNDSLHFEKMAKFAEFLAKTKAAALVSP